MAVHFRQHLIGHAPGFAIVLVGRESATAQGLADRRSMHVTRFHVLVVHHQQAIDGAALVGIRTLDREEVHAVMVGPDGIALLRTRQRKIVEDARVADGTTPFGDNLRAVAGRHAHVVVLADRDRVEAQQLWRHAT